MTWRERTACRAEEPELFFPLGTTGPGLEHLGKAKSVCQRCPVTSECLAWALETDQRAGVWGRLSEDERRELRPAATDNPTPLVLITDVPGCGARARRSGRHQDRHRRETVSRAERRARQRPVMTMERQCV